MKKLLVGGIHGINVLHSSIGRNGDRILAAQEVRHTPRAEGSMKWNRKRAAVGIIHFHFQTWPNI